MGLTIHYELRLPTSMAEDDVDDIVAALQAYARTLPFEHVSPVTSVSDQPLWDLPPSDRPLSDLPLDTSGADVWSSCLEGWAMLIAEPFDEDERGFTGDVTTARGFLVNPGEWCETATVGFLRCANTIGVPLGWYWQCSCKTQYASNISGAFFVACHTAVVALLDRAVRLGVDVTVEDETDYWEIRDEARLIRQVGSGNRLVERIAGPFVKVIGLEACDEAPIAGQRPFTRLETGEWEDED